MVDNAHRLQSACDGDDGAVCVHEMSSRGMGKGTTPSIRLDVVGTAIL